jgi:hypothetical protein
MRIIVGVLVILGAAAPARAQTHPCDTSPSAVSVIGNAPLWLLFCAKPSDDLVRAEVIVDNGPLTSFTETDAIEQAPPNAEGYAQFKVSIGTRSVGSHTVFVQVVNIGDEGTEQVSDPSDVLAFTVKAPKGKPAKPKATGVTK